MWSYFCFNSPLLVSDFDESNVLNNGTNNWTKITIKVGSYCLHNCNKNCFIQQFTWIKRKVINEKLLVLVEGVILNRRSR